MSTNGTVADGTGTVVVAPHDAEAVEAALSALKDEAARLRSIDPAAALRVAEELVERARDAGRPDHEALGLLARADALREMGRYEESVALYERGGDAFRAQRNEVGWARSRIGWVLSMHRLGRGAAALLEVEGAHEVLARHGEWYRVGGLALHAAFVCWEVGRDGEALRLYDRAQEAYERLGPSAELQLAWLQANRANVYAFRGDFRTALPLHEAARDVFARHGRTVSVLRQEQYIAYSYASQGDFTRALRRYADTLAAHERAGLEVEAGWVALMMVECYLRLNRLDEALTLARETIDRFERHGTPTEVARARFCCALAHARRDEREPALTLLRQAAEAFDATGLASQSGLATLLRASLHLGEGDWELALAEAERAYPLFVARDLAVQRAQADLVRARAHLALDRPDEAQALAGEALATAGARGVTWLVHEGHHVLAGVARRRGDLPGALDEADAAIASIEQVQSRLVTALRTDFLADKLAIYDDAIDAALRLGRPARAFGYLERAKSRALVDYLAGNPGVRLRARSEANQPLADELTRLRAEHDSLYDRLYGFSLGLRSEEGPAGGGETLQDALHDRERRIARITERLALDEAEAREGIVTPPLMPPPLDEDTVLLELYLRDGAGVSGGAGGARGFGAGDGEGAVFVATREGLSAVPLACRASDVRRLLQRWQLNLDAAARAVAAGAPLEGLARNARGILQGLYDALLRPVGETLTRYRRLVIVPYGPTHAVPWHALHDGERHLLERYEVTTCPSSSLLHLCRQRPRRPLRRGGTLVVACSDGGRLPHVAEEARAVADLLEGECYLEGEATRGALLNGAPGRAVLHLAAHGEARLDNPAFAHLKLADGPLTTADVFNLALDGALVTLSACETGRSVVTGGDELVGLSRGFLYAGARTLVQSLWRVEDRATARLMVRFYGALRDGQPHGAALRQAQLAALADSGHHPYFWAPFQLVGDDA